MVKAAYALLPITKERTNFFSDRRGESPFSVDSFSGDIRKQSILSESLKFGQNALEQLTANELKTSSIKINSSHLLTNPQ